MSEVIFSAPLRSKYASSFLKMLFLHIVRPTLKITSSFPGRPFPPAFPCLNRFSGIRAILCVVIQRRCYGQRGRGLTFLSAPERFSFLSDSKSLSTSHEDAEFLSLPCERISGERRTGAHVVECEFESCRVFSKSNLLMRHCCSTWPHGAEICVPFPHL